MILVLLVSGSVAAGLWAIYRTDDGADPTQDVPSDAGSGLWEPPKPSSSGPAGLPSFPGAQGFGSATPGGRAGRVIEVTTLADSGPGSLRAALEAEGARIVVFRTGGTIALRSEIDVRHPFVTVAGQTAPGDGITLKMSPSHDQGLLDISTTDVIIRYMRFRQGPHTATGGAGAKAAEMGDASRVVIDHCSLSWATDEVLTTYNNTSDITISWNIISEGLSNSAHYEGEHSRGMLISGDNSGNISAHHNLMAHNMRRNPEVSVAGTADIRNNVVYNWGTHAGLFTDKRDSTGMNVVGNFFKPGPSTTDDRHEIEVRPQGSGMALYVRGNIGPNRSRNDRPDRDSVSKHAREWLVSDPVPASLVTTTSAREAYENVIAAAGSRVPTLDSVDRRILREVRDGEGQIIDDPADVGGWPDLRAGTPPVDTDHDGMPDPWEIAHGLDPAIDDSAGYSDVAGYTNIEDYVNALVPPEFLLPPRS